MFGKNAFLRTVPSWFARQLIRFYQLAISPWLLPRCRFIPVCSEYTHDAINQHGFVRGFFLGLRRILRCHPFHPGGFDPVPQPKVNEK